MSKWIDAVIDELQITASYVARNKDISAVGLDGLEHKLPCALSPGPVDVGVHLAAPGVPLFSFAS